MSLVTSAATIRLDRYRCLPRISATNGTVFAWIDAYASAGLQGGINGMNPVLRFRRLTFGRRRWA